MTHVAIIGCGVVGAAIAYELSLVPQLTVTVFDRQPPAQASTGAALGVLMGIVSQKVKGRLWHLRRDSITRYATLIPELEAITQTPIPVNRQGIVLLTFEDDRSDEWDALIQTRQTQGWTLERWERDRLVSQCPQVQNARVTGAIYSPQDLQIDPTALTLALVEAAKQNGVTFRFGERVEQIQGDEKGDENSPLRSLQVNGESLSFDWIVIAAGLGTTLLSQPSTQPLEVRPVLGQAMRVKLPHAIGQANFQPVISGEDTHIVPLGDREYWVGATVEFADEQGNVTANPTLLDEVRQRAIDLCPDLIHAEVLQTWSGLRPRPQNRPAPVIEPLAGCSNVLLATGHYRNGVLLAPATALQIRDRIVADECDS